MSVFGIRRKLKSGVKKALGMNEGPSDTAAPNWQNRPATPLKPDLSAKPVEEDASPTTSKKDTVEATTDPEVPPVEAAEPEAPNAEEPVVDTAAAEGSEAEEDSGTADDIVGPALTLEAVQEILDDMVRPALQGDGGDITLLKVEDDNIHVKLVGACTTCPSSIMTMKMGVEALLREEFPSMKELIQEDAMVPHDDSLGSEDAL